ncbi:MAG: FapA family protein, partial [Synergistales bacterium]|nr:FapA family protein [Synergistales bacterium]
TPTPVGSLATGVGVPRLRITDDEMACYLWLPAGWTDPHTLLETLEGAGVVYGIRLDAIRAALGKSRSGAAVPEVLAAEGTRAVPGGDGRFSFITSRPSSNPVHGHDGTVISYLLNSIVPVSSGQTVGQYLPPSVGEPGHTVTGRTIPAAGGRHPASILGRGLALQGRSIIATQQGTLVWRGGATAVEPLEIVEGDLSPETASPSSSGHLLVTGHVRDGCNIVTEGHVEVRGNVGRAYLESRKGNITVFRGVLGRGGGHLRAGGEVRAGYIDEAIIEAETVVVNEYLSRSLVQARTGVKAQGKKGLLASSSIKANAHVHANNIHAARWNDTRISIPGVSRTALLFEYRLLPIRINRCKKVLVELSSRLRSLDSGTSPQDAQKLARRFGERSRELMQLQERLLYLHDLLLHLQGNATFSLSGSSTPGVDVTLSGVAARLERGCRDLSVSMDPFTGRFHFRHASIA